MKILKKINKGAIITLIVILILIIYIVNVENKRSKEKPEIEKKCEEYISILNEYFSIGNEENLLIVSQDSKENAKNKEESLKKLTDNKMVEAEKKLKNIMIENEKIFEMQLDLIKNEIEEMNNAYSNIVTSYNKKIAKIDKYEFDGNQVTVTFKAINEVEEEYVKKGEIDSETQKDKIEVRKNEEERPSEILTLQKVDGEWKIVYSEMVNQVTNSKGGIGITWEVY